MNPVFGILLIVGLAIGVYSGRVSNTNRVIADTEQSIDRSKSNIVNDLEEVECEGSDSSITNSIQDVISTLL